MTKLILNMAVFFCFFWQNATMLFLSTRWSLWWSRTERQGLRFCRPLMTFSFCWTITLWKPRRWGARRSSNRLKMRLSKSLREWRNLDDSSLKLMITVEKTKIMTAQSFPYNPISFVSETKEVTICTSVWTFDWSHFVNSKIIITA